jgi:hypothetical protein
MGIANTQVIASGLALDQQQSLAEQHWSTSQKVGFRFVFTYLCLYLYPLSSTLGWFWWFWVRWEGRTYEWPWKQVVPWVAANIFHVNHPVTSMDGGDTAYDHIKVFCFIVIAAVVTLIWSALDQKRANYSKLFQWTRWYVRAVLAFTMIGFGMFKVIPVQSPFPDLLTLMQPFGDIATDRLFWTFLGSSASYMVFAGIVETSGGILLLIPGLTTLGALVSLGALVAVLTQSGFHNVSVKLGVVNLIVLDLFLIMPAVPGLLNMLVFNRTVEPERRQPLSRHRWINYAAWLVPWAFGLYFIVSGTFTYRHELQMRSDAHTIPVYGIWKVTEFIADGQVRAPLLTDNLRWQRVIFDSDPRLAPKATAIVQQMDGGFAPAYIAALDTSSGTLSLNAPSDTELMMSRLLIHDQIGAKGSFKLTYTRPSPETMILEGPINGHQLRVALEKEQRQFPFVKTHEAHWFIEAKDTSF